MNAITESAHLAAAAWCCREAEERYPKLHGFIHVSDSDGYPARSVSVLVYEKIPDGRRRSGERLNLIAAISKRC